MENEQDMKRVWSHQNAELDKRACALFCSFVCFALSPTFVFVVRSFEGNYSLADIYTDIQGLSKKKRELSDKIRQDALDIERLEKRVEENKKKQKQVENLIDQGVQAKRKILETSKHVVMHLKRESEAFLHANGTEDGNEDSY
jgi:hypothetical protein